MKSIILFLFCLLVFSCGKFENEDIDNGWWKYGEGYHIGDVIDFKNSYWKLKNDTIYKNGNPVAILGNIKTGFFGDDNEMEIISIDTKEKGIYHEK